MDIFVNQRSKRQGQATILVTLSLLAMCGFIGFATDFGWAFYVRRSAQRAADAAALGATRAALQSSSITIDCVTMGCSGTPVSCDQISAANLVIGCAYSQRNGFSPGGHNGHQTVSLQANTGNPSFAPGVNAAYWVTARVTETVPQLFSAIRGHSLATVSAEATGAVTDVVVTGSLVLLNRSGDASPGVGAGSDILVGGGGSVTASGGILMSSNAANSGALSGSSRVINTAFTHIRGNGQYSFGNAGAWQNTPKTGFSDGPQFLDPLRDKGQPPLPTQILPSIAVPGGNLAGGSSTSPTILYPANYYATASCGGICVQATGAPIMLGSGYFSTNNNGSSFGTYIFYGGISTTNSTDVTFSPGRYVLAGTNGGSIFTFVNKALFHDHTSTAGIPAADAGEIFISTDLSYPGLSAQVPTLVKAQPNLFRYGDISLQSGSNAGSGINLHGLNATDPGLPPELTQFAPVVIWQDQGNSHILYTPDGNIDTSCPGATTDSPCTNPRVAATDSSPQLSLQASPGARFYGAIYQPRGAWTVIQGSGSTVGPLQIVTGALNMQGSGSVLMQGLANPLTTLTATLVE